MTEWDGFQEYKNMSTLEEFLILFTGQPMWNYCQISAILFYKQICMLSCFSRVRLFTTLWTIPHQAPLSMGFSKQEHWSELPALLQRIFPAPESKPASLMSPTLAARFFTMSTTWEAQKQIRREKYKILPTCPKTCDESQCSFMIFKNIS